jgi:hypothetical protein
MKNKILFGFIVLALVTSCNTNKTNRGVTTRPTDINSLNTGLTCATGQSNIGAIYDQNGFSLTGGASFEDRVKAFLSATINPSEIGTISSSATDSTGVRFQGVISLATNGQVNLTSTKIEILVYDSYVLNSQYATNGQKYEPIPVRFTSAAEGRFDPTTGAGFVVFRDSYGEVRFDGKYDAQYFSGTVSFKNTQAVSGLTPQQGTLGQFYVARCGIIQ